VGELWLVTAKNQQRKTTRQLHEEMSQRARDEEKIDEKKRAVYFCRDKARRHTELLNSRDQTRGRTFGLGGHTLWAGAAIAAVAANSSKCNPPTLFV